MAPQSRTQTNLVEYGAEIRLANKIMPTSNVLVAPLRILLTLHSKITRGITRAQTARTNGRFQHPHETLTKLIRQLYYQDQELVSTLL